MTYLYGELPRLIGSRLTGITINTLVDSPASDDFARAHLIVLPGDQDADVESDFLIGHLPFWVAALGGAFPDGSPWVVVLQKAPASASLLVGERDPAWVLRDSLVRALRFNRGAFVDAEVPLDRSDLLRAYRAGGVELDAVRDWTVADLVLGLLAECCYVPLEGVVAGREGGCAFPDVAHDCAGEVFADVFAHWRDGLTQRPEPLDLADEPAEDDYLTESDLWSMSRPQLRALARGFGVKGTKKASRKKLVKRILRAAEEELPEVRLPTGDELVVHFAPGDRFSGVDDEWLLARLRLDPEASPVDVRHAVMTVELDGDVLAIPDIELVCPGEETDGDLITVGTATSEVAFATRFGQWVREACPGSFDLLGWVGPHLEPRAYALACLRDFVDCLDVEEYQQFHVECDALRADDPVDGAAVLEIIDDRAPVILNGAVLTA